MARIKGEFKSSAERAKRCGFDGIEIHIGYGYYLDSFLRTGINQRTDAYGGSVENRARYPLEVLDAIIEVFDSQRVGLKLAPRNAFNHNSDINPEETLGYVIDQLNKRNVGFLEVSEGLNTGSNNDITTIKETYSKNFKKLFKGTWISNYGYTQDVANEHITNGWTDLVSFGWPYLANPDLVHKF
jgi:N-ethylmaleimide reductase